jgi:hypothetical protein
MAVAEVTAALTVLLPGCGGPDNPKPAPAVSDDQRQILATIDALQTASRRNDAARICREIFTPTLAKSIHDASKQSCEAEVRDSLTSPDARLSVARKIDIKGSRATTTIREQNGNMSTVSLVKTAGGWRIERVTPAKTP